MNIKINKFLLFLTLIIPYFIFSQSEENSLFEKKTLQQKTIQYKGEINFIKAHSFYLKKEWDSTLVYSMKQLSHTNNKVINNYCHYFRGISFFNKKIYKEAQKELFFISNPFLLLPQKNYYLGASLLYLREFDKALIHLNTAEKQSINQKETTYLADIYNGIGTTYIFLKQYDKAEEFLLKNLNLNNKKKKTLTEFAHLI